MGWFAGMLSSVALKPTKKGPMMAIVTLEDLDGSIEAVLFPQTLEKCRDVIEVDAVVRSRRSSRTPTAARSSSSSELEPFDGAEFGKPPEKLTIRTDCRRARERARGQAQAHPRALSGP